jgi:hypothetical protein
MARTVFEQAAPPVPQYRSRLYSYALCAMENDHSLTPDDAITQAESRVLEAAICV